MNVEECWLKIERDCKLFRPEDELNILMSDSSDLESTGVCVEGKSFRGSIACVIVDNLGSHYLWGFTENFSSAEYFCRYCHIRKEDFQRNPLSTATERTPASNSKSLLELENNPDMQIQKDIKSNSVLNKLTHFHVCAPGLPTCRAHALFEGIVDWFGNVLACSYDALNSRIVNFTGERQNKANFLPTNGTKRGWHAVKN